VKPDVVDRVLRALVGGTPRGWGEFTRVLGVDPGLQSFMPFMAVRLAVDPIREDHWGVMTFEIRLTRVCETVSGPRGLWWDEVVRLFSERLDFDTANDSLGIMELDIELDGLSAEHLWSPREE
jgi:hypothetical protein